MVKIGKEIVFSEQERFPSLTVPVAGLLIFFFLSLHIAVTKTPTADEGAHILRGRVLWQTGNLDLQGNHLPLSHWLIGSLLNSERSLPDVTQLNSWPAREPVELVQEFLWQSGAKVDRAVFLGRMPVIYLGLFVGAVLAMWSGLKTGSKGQTMVMVLFAFSPNLVALASLATTDLITVAMIFFALFSTWYFHQKPSYKSWILAAITLGLALSTKLSSVIIIPSTLLLAYIDNDKDSWWKPGVYWLGMLPVAGFVVWLIYGFEIAPVVGFPGAIPGASYINSVLSVTDRFNVGKSAYLLGERSTDGWWHYFVVAYLVKTPSITLILLLVTLIYISVRRRWRATAYLWMPALLLFAVASYSRFNIGYRHILAIVPLSWLLIAESAPFWEGKRYLRLLLVFSLAVYAVFSLRQQPDQLAYFNEFVGGSEQGPRYLGDSNIDWGQDLHLLAAYAKEVGDGPVFISYFGASDPAYYGLSQEPLFDVDGNPTGFSPANPKPGHYAISINHLQGATASEPDLFDWFSRYEPVDKLGYSIAIYDVPSDLDGEWVAHCYDPTPLVGEEESEILLDRSSLRHVYFECRSSWVLPTGEQPGWYILPGDIEPFLNDDFIREKLSLIYAYDSGSRNPPYHIYYWPGSSSILDQLMRYPTETTFNDGQPADLPLLIPGLATLEGSYINPPIWGSIWRTIAVSEAPLSVMLHLYGGGNSPDVADGLGFQANQWLLGDIFIQYSDYGDLSGRFLETTLYDFQTSERYLFKTTQGSHDTVRFYPLTTQ